MFTIETLRQKIVSTQNKIKEFEKMLESHDKRIQAL